MFAQMKHLAIVSSNQNREGEFYHKLFGLKLSGGRPGGAVVVRDGYLGLNINPRAPGRQAGLDHFGFEVQDVELVFSRLRERYPSIQVLKRPSNRPFAGISTHDPAGNVFDLSQQGMENRTDLYVEADREQNRYVRHFALRAVESERVAEFYRGIFDLTEMEKPAGDPNHYLSDGRVTLAILPWQISDFAGTGIERPALDHIGFKVEDLKAFKAELKNLEDSLSAPVDSRPEKHPEREARQKLFARSCCLGQLQFSDPDGVLIDVSEK
jgi:catechol 2,3-dioxygenase-like lactoylglutathione lyase family enzyme